MVVAVFETANYGNICLPLPFLQAAPEPLGLLVDLADMPPYRHLFFDLDHTLWDFDRNSTETLTELFVHYGLEEMGVLDADAFVEAFRKINFQLWDQYNRGLVNKREIREKRFPLIFTLLELKAVEMAQKIGDDYLRLCPRKPYLIEQSEDVLAYLAPKYKLHIITNGFKDVQSLKLKSAGIDHYFDCIVTSECSGHKKPRRGIFEYALQKSGARLDESLMIGDNLLTDIRGAIDFNMDCVYVNPEVLPHYEHTTYEVKELGELKGFL